RYFFQAEDGIRFRNVTSSDVCSSDLGRAAGQAEPGTFWILLPASRTPNHAGSLGEPARGTAMPSIQSNSQTGRPAGSSRSPRSEIGRASRREGAKGWLVANDEQT